MLTKYKTVKTKKIHKCCGCHKRINIGSVCTYGVTTDRNLVRYKGEIMASYFCTECRDIN